MAKKALICGISGQDGAYLANLLLGKGYEVVGTSRDAEVTSFTNLKILGIYDRIELRTMSLSDFRSVLQLLSRVRPDELYNIAGQSSVALSFEQPVETMESISLASLNLLEAIRFLARPTRLYNACSSECFGELRDTIADERTQFRPSSPYAVARAASFWQVATYREAYGLYACSGILFNHESPLRPPRFVTRKIVDSARRIVRGEQGKLLLGDVSISRDWGFAPEYVEGMWQMLQQAIPEDYVLATGEMHSLQEFCELAFLHEGVEINWTGSGIEMRGSDRRSGKTIVEVDPSLIRPSEIKRSVGNAAKARRQLGWLPRTAFSGLISALFADPAVPVESKEPAQ